MSEEILNWRPMALMWVSRDMATIDNPLRLLQKMLEEYYGQYRSGEITEKDYLTLIKPIDQAIDNLEMATLQDIPALRGSSLPLSHTPES